MLYRGDGIAPQIQPGESPLRFLFYYNSTVTFLKGVAPFFFLGLPGGRDTHFLLAHRLVGTPLFIRRLAKIALHGIQQAAQVRPPGEQIGDPPAQRAVGLVETLTVNRPLLSTMPLRIPVALGQS